MVVQELKQYAHGMRGHAVVSLEKDRAVSDTPIANSVDFGPAPDLFMGKSYRTATQASIQIKQPSGTSAKAISVPIEDVGPRGIRLRYPRFVHQGTHCEIELITLHGAWLHVNGVVHSCRYIQNGAHLLGIKFDEDIDVSVICPAAIETRAVFFTNSSFLPQLLQLWFKQRNVTCKTIESAEEIKDAIEFNANLVIVDSHLGEVPGPQIVEEIRTSAYFGLVAGLVEPRNDEMAGDFLNAGAELVINKPPDEKSILSLVDQSLSEATFSDHASDPRAKELLHSAIQTMNRQVELLAEAIRGQDLAALSVSLNQISDIAMTCGFLDISKQVTDLNHKLNQESQSAVALIAPLVRLIKAATA